MQGEATQTQRQQQVLETVPMKARADAVPRERLVKIRPTPKTVKSGSKMGEVTGVAPKPRVEQTLTPNTIQQYLDENQYLIQAIIENQNAGRLEECAKYQERLQTNLIFLASVADFS